MGLYHGLAIVALIIVLVVLADLWFRRSRRQKQTRTAQLRITSRVRGFAEMYVDTDKTLFRPAVIPDEDVVAFQRIVAEEHGLDIEYDLLAEMINEEVFRQECTHFERMLTSDHPLQLPVNVETLMERYIGVYSANMTFVPYLDELAKKKHVVVNPGWFAEQIPQRIKDRKLDKHAQKIKSAMKNRSREVKAITAEDLDSFDAAEFRDFLQDFFETMGYFVESARQSSTEGSTLLIEKLGEKTVVHAIQLDNAVGADTVQVALDAKQRHKCGAAIVVTNSVFTDEARQHAEQAEKVSLWDREKIAFLIDIYQKERIS